MVMWILVILGVLWLFNLLSTKLGVEELDYNEFYRLVEENLQRPAIKSIRKTENHIQGEFTPQEAKRRQSLYFSVYVPQEDKDLIPLLRKNVKEFKVEPPLLKEAPDKALDIFVTLETSQSFIS